MFDSYLRYVEPVETSSRMVEVMKGVIHPVHCISFHAGPRFVYWTLQYCLSKAGVDKVSSVDSQMASKTRVMGDQGQERLQSELNRSFEESASLQGATGSVERPVVRVRCYL